MGKILDIGGPRKIILQRHKFVIGWFVPVKVAAVWDEEYELMRAGTTFELWGLANGFATGTPKVSLDAVEFELDKKLYRKAYATCMTFNLNSVPSHLREEARAFCADNFELPVIEYMIMGPVSVQDYEGGESPE